MKPELVIQAVVQHSRLWRQRTVYQYAAVPSESPYFTPPG